MITCLTHLHVADNSGPLKVECIHVTSGSRHAHINDTIVVTVQKNGSSSKFKKGHILKAIIVRTKKGIVRPNGIHIAFADNAVVLLNKQHTLIANRIIGTVPRELRKYHQLKILSLASSII